MKTLNIRLALTVLVLTLFMGMALTVSAEDRINISTCNATVSPASQVYTGNAITYTTDQLTVTDPNGKILVGGVDFAIAKYVNNTNAGTAYIEISGIGSQYTGTKAVPFTITKANQAMTFQYNPNYVSVKGKTNIIVGGSHGALAFRSTNPSVASVNNAGVIYGKKRGNTTIVVTAAGDANFNPATANLSIKVLGQRLIQGKTKIKLSKKTYTYDGKAKKPSVKVTLYGKKLKNKKDYKVSYRDNKNAGMATVVITGKNKYSGIVTKTFRINKAKNPMKATIDDDTLDINEKEQIDVRKAKGEVTFQSSNSRIASVNDDGVVKGHKLGKCTITVTAAGNTNYAKVTKKIKVTVGSRDLAGKLCKVTVLGGKIVYDGDRQTPSVKVVYNGTRLKEDRDYTLSYDNNRNAGRATIYVKGRGKYKGTRKVYFTIYKASQSNFKASIRNNRIPLDGTARVIVSGARGKVKFGSESPSYAKHIGDGVYKGLKKTEDHVTITVTAEGDDNYKSKTIEIQVQIN